jgi:hypothetical protein
MIRNTVINTVLVACLLSLACLSGCGSEAEEAPSVTVKQSVSAAIVRTVGQPTSTSTPVLDQSGDSQTPASDPASASATNLSTRIAESSLRLVSMVQDADRQALAAKVTTLVETEGTPAHEARVFAEEALGRIEAQEGVPEGKLEPARTALAEYAARAALSSLYRSGDRLVPNMPEMPIEPIWEDPRLLDVIPPPAGPGGDAMAHDETMQALMMMAGIGMCIYAPPACPAIAAFLGSMGLGEELAADIQMFAGIGRGIENGEFDIETRRLIERRVRDAVDDKHYDRMVRLFEAVRDADSGGLPGLIDTVITDPDIQVRFYKELPDWGKIAIDKLRNKESAKEVIKPILVADDGDRLQGFRVLLNLAVAALGDAEASATWAEVLEELDRGRVP